MCGAAQNTDDQPETRTVDSESGERQTDDDDDAASTLKYEIIGEFLVGATRLQQTTLDRK